MKRRNVKFQKGGHVQVAREEIKFTYGDVGYDCLLVNGKIPLFVGDEIKFNLEKEPDIIAGNARGLEFNHEGTINKEYMVQVGYAQYSINTQIDLKGQKLTILEHRKLSSTRPKIGEDNMSDDIILSEIEAFKAKEAKAKEAEATAKEAEATAKAKAKADAETYAASPDGQKAAAAAKEKALETLLIKINAGGGLAEGKALSTWIHDNLYSNGIRLGLYLHENMPDGKSLNTIISDKFKPTPAARYIVGALSSGEQFAPVVSGQGEEDGDQGEAEEDEEDDEF
jgi:hypothetical protein